MQAIIFSGRFGSPARIAWRVCSTPRMRSQAEKLVASNQRRFSVSVMRGYGRGGNGPSAIKPRGGIPSNRNTNWFSPARKASPSSKQTAFSPYWSGVICLRG